MDGVMELVDTAVTSPWFYLVLFVVAAVDGFFPVVPSESLVITAGAYAASGAPDPALAVALAALGAFTGDHVSYLLGRGPGGRAVRAPAPGTRRHAALGWARRTLAERGGLILVVARYVPGGRTAVTLTMGAVRYPGRSFALFAAVAAVSWALYGVLLGHVGGLVFQDDPLKGVAAGIGLALAVTAVAEAARLGLRRRAARRPRTGGPGAPGSAASDRGKVRGSV